MTHLGAACGPEQVANTTTSLRPDSPKEAIMFELNDSLGKIGSKRLTSEREAKNVSSVERTEITSDPRTQD